MKKKYEFPTQKDANALQLGYASLALVAGVAEVDESDEGQMEIVRYYGGQLLVEEKPIKAEKKETKESDREKR